MTLTQFRGRCYTCGHDREENDFVLPSLLIERGLECTALKAERDAWKAEAESALLVIAALRKDAEQQREKE